MAPAQPPSIDPAITIEAGKLQVDVWWRQYELWATLYRDYLNLLLRMNLFFYAITGAILSYHLGHQRAHPETRFALLLPILMSFAFGVFSIYCARLMPYMRNDVFDLRDKLGLRTAADCHVLTVLLYVFGAIFFLVTIGLLGYLVFQSGWLLSLHRSAH